MKTQKWIAWLLTVAMIAAMLPVFAVGAVTEPDVTGYAATNQLTESGEKLVSNSAAHVKDSGYDGYIQTDMNDQEYFDSTYVRVTYTVAGEVTNDTKPLILQTFDTGWGGWAGIEISIGDSIYDAATGIYTAYVYTGQLLATLTTGKDLMGVNISFLQAEPAVTLLSYETLSPAKEEEEKPPVTATVLSPTETIYTITEEDLTGIDWQSASKVKVYVKMTEGGSWSVVNAMVKLGPNGENGAPVGKASSKYLVGSDPLVAKSGNIIQNNLVGNAGTGCYVFPDVNLNHTMQDGSAWDESYANEITITISLHTSETNCELLGLVFNNGVSYPEGFTAPVTEATTLDVEPEADVTYKDKLQFAVDFVAKMDQNAYEAESWTAFMAVVDEAKALLASASATEAEFTALHAKLEKTKSQMRFAMSEDAGSPLPFRDLSGEQLVYEMALGTNLGNTMDGHSGFTPSETAWQSVTTTIDYMNALHDAGYNTVRIPVTWGNMIDGDISSGYTINENWLDRVQQIVDYCVSQDMYAIINIHHDGAEQSGWLLVASDEIDEVYYQFAEVWRIIAERFKDYDEHLIFESMNEITCMEGDMKNSADAIAYDTPIIMNLNQIFVNVVRSTGSNNQHRWLAAVAHYANNGSHEAFSLPEDTYNENSGIMFAAHIYKHSTNTSWTYDQIYEVVDGLKRMANKFDVPMYLGEWGNRIYEQEGTATGYNDIERAYFCEIVTRACQVAGVVSCVWDQGFGTKGEHETGLFSYWNRAECRPIFKTIIDAMIRGAYLPATDKNLGYDMTDIVKDPAIKPITAIALAQDSVSLILGENATVTATASPADSNDVLLWSTDDPSVATVTRGIIRARGIGNTTIRVYSQNGSVEKTISVTVLPQEVDKIAISTNLDSYKVVAGKSGQIAAVADGQLLTYRSSNPEIVTVNAFGKLSGITEGTAYITVTAASGLTKTVQVQVVNAENTSTINLALHILYNDAAHSYWGCELSVPVVVNGDGTYTLSFDLSKEISDAAKKAGITEINALTAIYIKDLDVTNGNAKKSPLESADIVYNSVIINGTPLTMIPHDPVSAINAGGVFDSGKPINGWDGSVVEEVSVSDHSVTFTSVSNPTTIEVTFTLSNVVFRQAESGDSKPAQSITADGETTLTLEGIDESAQLKVNVSPANADTKICFVSSDASVISVDSTGIALENGAATVTILALGAGTATVTAMTENGLTVEYTITVAEPSDAPVEPAPTDPTEPTEPRPTEPAPTEPKPTQPATAAPAVPAEPTTPVASVPAPGEGLTWGQTALICAAILAVAAIAIFFILRRKPRQN